MCVRVRAMLDVGDGDETGTGSHKAYMMAAWWCGIRASAQGVVWPGARCQVGERRQRAERKKGSSPGAQVQAWRRLVWRAETGGVGRWLGGTTVGLPRRLDKDKDGQEPTFFLSCLPMGYGSNRPFC